jgi:hypothetical protein
MISTSIIKKAGALILLISTAISLSAQFDTNRLNTGYGGKISGRYKIVMIGASSIEPKTSSTYYPCLGAELPNNDVANDVQYTQIGGYNASQATVDPALMGIACNPTVKYAFLYWGAPESVQEELLHYNIGQTQLELKGLQLLILLLLPAMLGVFLQIIILIIENLIFV